MLSLQKGWEKVTFLCDQVDNEAQSICYTAPETTCTKHHVSCTTVTWDSKQHLSETVFYLKKDVFSPYDEYLNFTNGKSTYNTTLRCVCGTAVAVEKQ